MTKEAIRPMYMYLLGARRAENEPLRWWEYAVFVVAITFCLGVIFAALACTAHAQDGPPPDATRLVLPQTQLIAAIVGSLVPVVTYLLNYQAPWLTEAPKAAVLVVVAAAAGALATLLDTGGIPVTWETAQVVGTAVALALLAHFGFWKPSSISSRLGGGRNRQTESGVGSSE